MDSAARDPLADLRLALGAEAQALGFADCRVADPAGAVAAGRRLRAWVADGQHGDMAWMADRLDWRADPRTLWPAVRAVVMLAEPYTPAHDPLAVLDQRDRAAISVYAQGRDYHDVVKRRLKRLGRWLIDRAPGTEIKVFVDTAPVMEKPLAAAAGLGWQGKHTNLVARRGGSWFFLGAIFTTLPLAPDEPAQDHCGSCRRCLDVCPTDAFPAPYRLDARRCISYLTIELKGPIPRPLRPLIGNRIYGCDDCLAVCPWNRFAVAANAAYAAQPARAAPSLDALSRLDDAGFRALFAGSPIKRTGRARFLRNVAVAIGNSADPALVPAAWRLAADAEPLVRGHAAWALGRLLGPEALDRRPCAGTDDEALDRRAGKGIGAGTGAEAPDRRPSTGTRVGALDRRPSDGAGSDAEALDGYTGAEAPDSRAGIAVGWGDDDPDPWVREEWALARRAG